MSSDSVRGATPEPDRRPASPTWEFHGASVERRDLDKPVLVPRGVESVEVLGGRRAAEGTSRSRRG